MFADGRNTMGLDVYLNDNSITSLPEDLFDGVDSGEVKIDLRGNPLLFVPTRIVQRLEQGAGRFKLVVPDGTHMGDL
jgi:hypothetical protein